MTHTLNPEEFRAALSKFATGIAVITTHCPSSGPAGITVNSFASVSLDPPLVLWSLAKPAGRMSVFAPASDVAIHILSAKQKELCIGFTKNAAAFPDETKVNKANIPILEQCLARFDCTRHAQFDGGDHLIFVEKVVSVECQHGEPLLFFDSSYRHLS